MPSYYAGGYHSRYPYGRYAHGAAYYPRGFYNGEEKAESNSESNDNWYAHGDRAVHHVPSYYAGGYNSRYHDADRYMYTDEEQYYRDHHYPHYNESNASAVATAMNALLQ